MAGKRYKSDDGSYLGIDEQDGAWRVAWYLPEDEDFGAYVGDRDVSEYTGGSDEKKKARWEIMTADAAAKPFADGRKDMYGYRFDSEKQARLAMLAANTSLLNSGAPMPDWAVKATAAGWKPPKGWKP